MSQYCVIGRHGLLGSAIAARLGEVTPYPTEKTRVLFHFGSRTHPDFEANPHFAEGHLFLAKLYIDLNENLDEAARLARKGLELRPSPELAPLGHYVLADVYAREQRTDDSLREAALGRALEMRMRRQPATVSQ